MLITNVQGNPKLFFSTMGFVLIFLSSLIYLLELNKDLKYFFHLGRVLERKVESHTLSSQINQSEQIPHREICLDFKF